MRCSQVVTRPASPAARGDAGQDASESRLIDLHRSAVVRSHSRTFWRRRRDSLVYLYLSGSHESAVYIFSVAGPLWAGFNGFGRAQAGFAVCVAVFSRGTRNWKSPARLPRRPSTASGQCRSGCVLPHLPMDRTRRKGLVSSLRDASFIRLLCKGTLSLPIETRETPVLFPRTAQYFRNPPRQEITKKPNADRGRSGGLMMADSQTSWRIFWRAFGER
jgi:hypothetical protein